MTFEEAFSEFIERREYDEASEVLFHMVRISFEAGWRAAGGDVLRSQNVIELICNQAQNDDKGPP